MSTSVQKLFDLSGKTALITGGSRGLGLQIAEALGEAGAKLMLSSRKASDLEEAAAYLKSKGIDAGWVAADASDPVQVQKICDAAMQQLGQIDILVNNAGATWGAPTEDYPLEAWDKVMNLNIRGIFLMCQAVGKASMIPRRQGRIINIASIACGQVGVGFMGSAHYSATKGGIIGMTETMALEWGPLGITVNAIGPGAIDTPMVAGIKSSPASMKAITDRVPLGRMGTPEEIAAAVVFLAADEASYVTGATLFVDGGYLAA